MDTPDKKNLRHATTVSNAPARPVFGRPLVHHQTSQDRATTAAHARRAVPPLTYRPLGVSPAQLADRIHTVQDPAAVAAAPYGTHTFTACVSGTPKTFVIPIVSGPT